MRSVHENQHQKPLSQHKEQPRVSPDTAEERSPDADLEKPQENLIVAFEGQSDPLDPQNWHWLKKLYATIIISLIAFVVCMASSIDAPVIPQASARFHVSAVTESLATALFLIGFGCGAPFAGPLSEAFGRNPVYVVTFTIFCIWIMGAALAPNIGGQLVFRFLAGVFGSTPFTTLGGTLADLYDHKTRGMIFPYFACFAFVGVNIGPVIGGYVGQSGIDWRFTEWITLCISGGILVLVVFTLPETYGPIILTWKAKALRSSTGDARYRGALEVAEVTIVGRMRTALTRPFAILFSEPIVVLFTVYLTLLYAVSFSFFSSFPFIFGRQGIYGFDQGATYLVFLAIVVGVVLCTLATPLFGILIGMEVRKAAGKGCSHPPPEAMLWWAMIGSPMLPVSLFWLAWTTYRGVNFWSAIISCALFGFSQLSLFISTYAYLIQTYGQFAASALAINVFIRYVIGGSMVVVSIPMYENLGVHHALTIWASIGCVVALVPYGIYLYGEKLRAMSRWVPH